MINNEELNKKLMRMLSPVDLTEGEKEFFESVIQIKEDFAKHVEREVNEIIKRYAEAEAGLIIKLYNKHINGETGGRNEITCRKQS